MGEIIMTEVPTEFLKELAENFRTMNVTLLASCPTPTGISYEIRFQKRPTKQQILVELNHYQGKIKDLEKELENATD